MKSQRKAEEGFSNTPLLKFCEGNQERPEHMAAQEEEWGQHLGVADSRETAVSHLSLVAE